MYWWNGDCNKHRHRVLFSPGGEGGGGGGGPGYIQIPVIKLVRGWETLQTTCTCICTYTNK